MRDDLNKTFVTPNKDNLLAVPFPAPAVSFNDNTFSYQNTPYKVRIEEVKKLRDDLVDLVVITEQELYSKISPLYGDQVYQIVHSKQLQSELCGYIKNGLVNKIIEVGRVHSHMQIMDQKVSMFQNNFSAEP